jgi:hypothetical protein
VLPAVSPARSPALLLKIPERLQIRVPEGSIFA